MGRLYHLNRGKRERVVPCGSVRKQIMRVDRSITAATCLQCLGGSRRVVMCKGPAFEGRNPSRHWPVEFLTAPIPPASPCVVFADALPASGPVEAAAQNERHMGVVEFRSNVAER
jgi:hypothetical protein